MKFIMFRIHDQKLNKKYRSKESVADPLLVKISTYIYVIFTIITKL